MADATITYSTPAPALSVGTTHAGFTVISAQALPEISGCAYVFRHDASGARALWLACPDDNTSFSIAFKTPPADDTGVFHILEHSVLCGSDSYPVKEPFVNLLKTSMQTFLNALTFPDKTMARRQDMLAFSGRPAGWRDDIRRQELAATPEAVRTLAGALSDGSCSQGICVFGPREAIEASNVDFEITELIGRGEE